MATTPAQLAAEAAAVLQAKQGKDRRLRDEFKQRLDTNCALLVDNFHGLIRTAHIDGREGAKPNSQGARGVCPELAA